MRVGLAKRWTSIVAFIVTVAALGAGFMSARSVSRAQVAFENSGSFVVVGRGRTIMAWPSKPISRLWCPTPW